MSDEFASHLASNTKCKIGSLHLLEELARRRHETLGFVLKCSVPHEPPWPTQCGRISLPKESNHTLEMVASCRHEKLSFLLSIRTLKGLLGKH